MKNCKASQRRSLLIVECDHEKLKSQRLSLAQEVSVLTQLLFPRGKIDLVLTSTEDDLRKQFGQIAESKYRYRRILVVAHSSSSGICLTSGPPVRWNVFANWISIFEPEILYLVGCQSALEEAVTQLCRNLESVKQIIGSRENISKLSARLIYSALAEPHLRRSQDRDLPHAISKLFLPAASLVFDEWRC